MLNKLFIIIVILGFSGIAYSAPGFRVERTLVPETDSTYELGTSTRAWRNIFTDEVCLAGDCKTAWPTGSAGGGSSNWTIVSGGLRTSTSTDFAQAAYFRATSTTATSTFAAPISLGNNHVESAGLKSFSSSGVDLHALNGAIIANFGAGGGTNATFNGGVNITGATGMSTFTATHGTSTNFAATNIGLFGNSLVSTANALCVQLTGSAALCDGSDDGGGGGGELSDWQLGGTGYIVPTTTVGIVVSASSTIGNGTQGLTVSGPATTTGNAYIGGRVSIGTTTNTNLINVDGAGLSNSLDLMRIQAPIGYSGGGGAYLRMVNASGTTQFSVNSFGNFTASNGATFSGTVGTAPANGNLVVSPTSAQNGISIKSGAAYTGDYLRILDNSNNILLNLSGTSTFLGVGSSSPTRMLTVGGDIFALNNITAASATITYASSTGFTSSNLFSTNSTLGFASSTSLTVSGNTYLSSLSDGCLSTVSGLVTSSGSACGSGSGGGGSNWSYNGVRLTPTTTTAGMLVNGSSTISLLSSLFSTTTLNHYIGGTLGLGTTTPSANLALVGTSGRDLFSFASSTGLNMLRLGADGGLYFGTSTDSDIYINTAPNATIPMVRDNIAIGNQALQFPSTTSIPQKNIAIGSGVLQASLANRLTGSNNVGLGDLALNANFSGSRNMAIGDSALGLSNIGNDNVAIGYIANPFGAAQNVAIGSQTLSDGPYVGTGTIAIGYQAGFSQSSGNQNIVIGHTSELPNLSASNQLNLANIIYGTNVNAGGSTVSGGNIGIGSTSPSRRLTVSGNIFTPNNITAASGTITHASTTGLTVSGSAYIGSLNGLLRGTSGLVSTASNGTDFTLITSTTCSGSDKVSSVLANGTVTCSPDQTGGGGGGSSNWIHNLTLDALTPSTTVGVIINASSTFGGTLNVASTSYNYINNLFSVSTTSNLAGSLLSIYSTTTLATNPTSTTQVVNGSRSIFGNLPAYYRDSRPSSNFFVNGIVESTFANYQCDAAMMSAAPTVEAVGNTCLDAVYFEDTTAGTAGISSMTLGNSTLQSLTLSDLTGNSGVGLFFAGATQRDTLASSTPRLDGLVSSLTTSSSTIYAGFANITPSGATFEVGPTAFVGFIASTTFGGTGTWYATIRTSNTASTTFNTGVPSTTPLFFTVQTDASDAFLWFGTSTANRRLALTGSIGGIQNTAVAAGVYFGRGAGGTTAAQANVAYMEYWKRKPYMLNNM